MAKETKITGTYSEQYKGGPVLQTDNGIIYLIGLENSSYEGKTLEVTGVLSEDKEHVVNYQPGEVISQGWATPRKVMNVSSFKVLK